MTGLWTATRYELRMQLRRRSMWITAALMVALLTVISLEQIRQKLTSPDTETAMAFTVFLLNLLLPVGYGCLLADRLIRDTRLRVLPVLEATPAAAAGRLLGKYLGVCAAAAAPVAIAYYTVAAGYAIINGRPWALAAATAMFATVTIPAVLFVAAFALAVPLVMPAPLFRVLFVGYWFWGNAFDPKALPTLTSTPLTPIGSYPLEGLFGYRPGGESQIAGPVPGATLNVLRPEPTTATAWLSIAILLTVAAFALAAGYALRARTTR